MLHLSQWTSQFVQNISMTIRHPLSLDKEKLPKKPHSLKGKMGETSGRATEEGSLSQDGQKCNRCRV